MNGKWRFSPRVTTLLVLAWLAGLMIVFFVRDGKRALFHAGLVWLVDFLTSLTIPAGFLAICGNHLVDLATAALLLASAWCIGLALLRLLRWVDRLDALTNLLAAAAGFGTWAWFVFLAGLLGWISPVLYLAPSLLSLLLAVWHWPWVMKQCREFSTQPRQPWNGFEIFLLACLVCGFLLNLVPAFSPEVEYDTLEYHLGALKEYQKAGHIFFLAHNFYASMPSLTEMLYLWGVVLRSSTVAKLIHGTFAVLTATGLATFGARLHSRRAGLLAAALFYLLPFVTSLADTARIDLATTYFAFVAGMALHRFVFDAERNFLWLAALTAGLTLATKYTAGPVVLLPLLLILILQRNGNAPRSTLDAPRFLLLALVPVLPWLIKNAAFTGNPFYPIANGIFHSPYWDAVCAARFQEHHAPTFHGLETWAGLVTSAWAHSTADSFSSPILVCFAPLFLLLAKPDKRWKFCAWFGGLIYICWWTFTFRPWRFLFPALPWFALIAATAIVSLEKERATGWLVRTTLGILLVFNLNYSFLFNAIDLTDPERLPPRLTKLAVFLGRVQPAEYLGNLYYTLGWIGHNLPPDACVLFVGEARIYYTPQRVLANTVYDKSILGEMVARSKTPDDLLREMKEAGVTHIYVNQDELDRLRQNYGYLKDMNWDLFHRFLETHTKVLLKNNAHAVYAIANKS